MGQAVKFDPLSAGLPVAEESERFLLGSCLAHNRFAEAEPRVPVDFFGLDSHRSIWTAMNAISAAGDPVNLSTLMIWIQKNPKEIENLGGIGYIIGLTDNLPDISNIEPYVREVRDSAVRRRLMIHCNEALIRLSDRRESTAEISAELAQESQDCAGSVAERSGFSTISETILGAGSLDGYLTRRNRDGLGYPWFAMNRATGGGMRPGNLIVVAGPPGGGKTALALNCAFQAARSDAGVAVFSLEMDREEITDRMISIAGKLDGRSLRRESDAAARTKIRAAVAVLQDLPFFVHDETSPSIKSVRAEAKRLAAKEKIGLIIVDYIQLVEGAQRKGSTRAEDVGHITRQLKRLAVEMKVPVIALSQLNRESAKHNRPPELRDLRESGSIEQDANLVAMIHFTRRYDTAAGVDTGDLDLLIRKQRSGPVGTVRLTFHAPSGVFEELGHDY